MPKEIRVNSSSFDRSMVSPYSRTSKVSDTTNPSPHAGDEREWEQARCPICIEHPHNAVLLLCSSREKGCRPFICDTSYRHSNCLDQFRKSSLSSHPQQSQLVCPLCRGSITDWDVVRPARRFMNNKRRNCSLDTCKFNGDYSELRKHARAEHPLERPSEASPPQRSDWMMLEQQMDMEDALAYQSDIEPDWDGFLSWDGFAENNELWNEGSFFDLPSGLSDIGDDLSDEMLSGLSLPFMNLHSSFHDDELMDSGSSVFNLVENDLLDLRSVSRSNIENDLYEDSLTISSRILRNGRQNVFTRTRSSYHEENRSISRSRPGNSLENAMVSSQTRTSYREEYTHPSSRARSRSSRQQRSGFGSGEE